ncbi:S8 family serine peptidase [Microcoleus sp. FACHB-SPT15]|uniref:S8 family serine peptidase n=1 Tax=Microcoleus sp. FACHB-SPT15 TaxID=2692830 RepID=UPI001786D78C|nr:S8 family serine peptidase [Microcoleus sp. FACHB-SPT15]MBD1806295.1 S8 family serine peptidase [Microcoleus sp. FACHB-SPT15]
MDWLNAFTKKRSLTQPPQLKDKQAPKPLKIFKLEPILTPSGVLDTDLPTLGWMDVTDSTPDPLDLDYSTDDVTDLGADSLPDIEVEIPEIFQTTEVVDSIDLSSSTYDSGFFTVGESGEIGIDFLYDGGAYQGELAIFSLEGLDPNSDTFAQEAAERALSNSPEQGYVVISDPTEGARFSGVLPGEGDHNAGNYQGVTTFTMAKGTQFGIMLVPNGTVQEVLDGHGVGDKLPVFSMATANPNDTFHLGQLADVTGDGSTFVLEDMRVDTGSDKDYNDIVFQVRGATAEAATMDQLITDGALDEAKDWRDTDMGEALISYAEPYITPEVTILEPLPEEAIADLVISPPTDEFDPAEPDGYDFPQENQPLIGVIDTGFSANNPYLDYERITLGQDLVDGDANPLLEPGEVGEHGTHIVGVIDSGNNDAPLWVGRAVDSGQWADSLVEFVDAAKESGQPNAIVNLSFDLTQINPDGTETTRYEFTPEERAALEYARQNNVLIVAAAGNDGNVMSVLGQASQEFDNIITVGSAENVDPSVAAAQGFDRVDYSSYGYGLDIMAEGGTTENPVQFTAGDDFGMAGTSVATAEVTGAASQVWAANPELSYEQVIDILKSTATDLNTPNWDTRTGAGLLNIVAAVELAKATRPESYTAPPIDTTGSWSGEGEVIPTERAVSEEYNGKYYDWVPYTIQYGDTLSQIALNTLGDSSGYQFIAEHNGIADPDVIYVGDSIEIPVEVLAPQPQPQPQPQPLPTGTFEYNGNSYVWVSYTIQGNDTLSQIALNTLGDSSGYQFIAEHNGIVNPNLIIVGQVIEIPQAVSNPTPPTQPQPPQSDAELIERLVACAPSSIQGYARESIPVILAACEAAGVTEPAQIAYILATAQHESHLGQWMEELASGEAYEGRTDLGNTQPGDGVRYKGRGYVQITGRSNYTNWSRRLGIDLVNQPELASDPEIAAQILVEGMRDGTFTGVGLSDYISGSNIDFYNARRIVNGTDRASEIAQMAERYYNVLNSTSDSDTGSSPDQLPPTTGYRPYYVKSGDTPSGIAFNELNGNASRWTEILKEDGTPLTNWDTTHLQVGQLLYLPFGYQSGTGNPVTPPPNPEPQPVPSPDPNIYTKQEFENSWRNLPEYTSDNPFPSKGSNCTWYAHGRMMELGYSEAALDTMLGNAGMWNDTAGNGATLSNTPSVPCIAVWEAGVGEADPKYGHVAVVEQINADGSIVISESGLSFSYKTRTISPGSYWPTNFVIVPKA